MRKKLLTLACCVALVLSACTPAVEQNSQNTGAADPTATPQDAALLQTGAQTSTYLDDVLNEIDADPSYDEATATKITFDGATIAVDGMGASASGSTLTITQAGVYVLSGTLTSGQVIVDAADTDTVRLICNGVNITASTNAAIHAKNADKVIITLLEGTTNALKDAENFVYESEADEEPNAALFSKTDLVFNGTGALHIDAAFKHGIVGKDDVIIYNGTYDVTANSNGIRGRDRLIVVDGTFTINAGNDGLQSNNDADVDKGYITLYDGHYEITAKNDGLQAETNLTIYDGDYTITTNGGSETVTLSATSSQSGRMGGNRQPGAAPGTETSESTQEQAAPATTDEQADDTASTSYKGLKAGQDILIEDGVFSINAADDAIHCNGNIVIKSGDFTLLTGDDGMHADNTLTIYDGTIDIPHCYEGVEAMEIKIHGGTIDIVAFDDGINAAGGTDTDEPGGQFGRDQFSGQNTGAYAIEITGGVITVDAEGDGIDSNGNINMSGGEAYVYGPSSGADSAIDYDGTFTMTGGTLYGASASQMAQGPGDSSTQCSLMLYFTSSQAAGTKIELIAEDQTIAASISPKKAFPVLVVSTPSLVQGSTYGIYVNGEKTADITLESIVTRVSETGEATQGGMGFGGGGGGRPGGGNRGNNAAMPDGAQPPEGMQPPDDAQLPEGMTRPDRMTPPNGGTDAPPEPNGENPPNQINGNGI
ncbi:carbohydrate-binding domain-containing protein [Christensenellaceae bacterium OttesenSCG-928-M15]|nr:carbohydrate-binding domain-containing protein [Christensenellaceae bacterium OttesenSCG-928-M15]